MSDKVLVKCPSCGNPVAGHTVGDSAITDPHQDPQTEERCPGSSATGKFLRGLEPAGLPGIAE